MNVEARQLSKIYGRQRALNSVDLTLQAGQITQAQLQTNVLGAAAAEIQQVGRLMGAGARYVVVFALPDIGVTPAFAGSPFASAGSSSATARSLPRAPRLPGRPTPGLREPSLPTRPHHNPVPARCKPLQAAS